MAQAASSVECIDPFDGRATDSADATCREAFISNLAAYGVEEKVTARIGTTAQIAPHLEPGYDLIFIDGAHDVPSVRLDIRESLRLLAPGGLLAFHDYRLLTDGFEGRRDPGVAEAVNELLGNGAKLLERVHSLAVVKPEGTGIAEKPRVFMGMPRYSGTVEYTAARAFFFPTLGMCEIVNQYSASWSLLEHCFNHIWCKALDARDTLGATHFVMQHSDVAPPVGYLDTLYPELGDADMVSVVIPIKNSCGNTSTALNTGDPWLPRRLTMREIMKLPETFGPEDVGYPLLLNTGLWICDLRKPWCDQVCFDSIKRIVKKSNGERVPQCIPEDWFWSNALNELGCKLKATRKVKVSHHGERQYPNTHAWGLWETDKVYQEAHEKPNPILEEKQCVSVS